MNLELGLILSLILKPAVLILAIYLGLKFYQLRESEPGFSEFAISTLALTLGEFACAIDVYYFSRMTPLNEGLHDLGMALSFSFLILGISDRILGSRSCFRKECPQFSSCELQPGACKIFIENTRMLKWSLLGLCLMALLLFAVEPVKTYGQVEAGVGESVFGSYLFFRTPTLMFFQYKFLPGLALVMIFSAWVVISIVHRMNKLSIYLMSFGSGTLIFVYFRYMMIHFYDPNLLWVGLVEEILEFFSVLYLWLWFQPKFKRSTAAT